MIPYKHTECIKFGLIEFMTNIFGCCLSSLNTKGFASLEAKRKFRVPRVTPNHPSLRSETHPGEEINETAISYNINCSPATLTYSGNMGIVDPTKNPVSVYLSHIISISISAKICMCVFYIDYDTIIFL